MSEFNLNSNVSTSQIDNDLEVSNKNTEEKTSIYDQAMTQVTVDPTQVHSLLIEQEAIKSTSEIFEHSKTGKFEWNNTEPASELQVFEDESMQKGTSFDTNNDEGLLQEKSDIYRREAVGLIAPSVIFVNENTRSTQKPNKIIERSQPGTWNSSTSTSTKPETPEKYAKKQTQQPLENGLRQTFNHYIFRGAAIALTITVITVITNDQKTVKLKKMDTNIILQSKTLLSNTKQATQNIYNRIKEIKIMEKNMERNQKRQLEENAPKEI